MALVIEDRLKSTTTTGTGTYTLAGAVYWKLTQPQCSDTTYYVVQTI